MTEVSYRVMHVVSINFYKNIDVIICTYGNVCMKVAKKKNASGKISFTKMLIMIVFEV